MATANCSRRPPEYHIPARRRPDPSSAKSTGKQQSPGRASLLPVLGNRSIFHRQSEERQQNRDEPEPPASLPPVMGETNRNPNTEATLLEVRSLRRWSDQAYWSQNGSSKTVGTGKFVNGYCPEGLVLVIAAGHGPVVWIFDGSPDASQSYGPDVKKNDIAICGGRVEFHCLEIGRFQSTSGGLAGLPRPGLCARIERLETSRVGST